MQCIPVPGKTKRGARLGSIPGMVPILIGDLAGCSFHNRCPHAHSACASTNVRLRDIAPGRGYRCLLSPEICAENAIEAAP